MLGARENLPGLEHVIVVDGEAPEGTIALAEIEGANPEFDVAAAAAEVAPEDVLTLIYTSGTTGHPKGVQLTHHAVMFTVRQIEQIIDFPPGSRVISWLPSAHIAERNAHHYIPIVFAGTITCAPDPREVLSYLPQVRPNWFFAVPRIWEKLKAGLEAMQAAQPEEQVAPVREAVAASIERVRLRQRGEPVPDELEAKVAEADATLFSKLREMLGLDQALAVNVGAAPTPVDVLEFFHAIGIELSELWGMSETCGIGAVNRPGEVRIGTVGPASPGVELKLAQDGEVLCRGEFMMSGYRNQPEKTAEALDADGWLHTGDIGEIDADGLSEDRRSQEGADHQRGRQEHVPGQHRGGAEVRLAADRPGVLHRRPPALQHGADRARRGLRAAVGGPATASEGVAFEALADRGHRAGRGPGGSRSGQRAIGAGRADQEVPRDRRRLAARRR